MSDINNHPACPIVHLNGSSRESLLEEWAGFYSALNECVERFPFESFNPRNHYIKGDAGLEGADDAKFQILRQLNGLRDLAEQIAEELNK